MSRIMWRESRCQPQAQSHTSDSGLLQINRVNHKWLTNRMGAHINAGTLANPTTNIQAAAHLYTFWNSHAGNGYTPWKATK